MMKTYELLLEECQTNIQMGNYHAAMAKAHEILDFYETHHLEDEIFNVFQNVEKLFANTPDAILYITYMQRLIKILKEKKRYKALVNAMYYLSVDLIASKNYTFAELYLAEALGIAKINKFYDSEADLYNGYGNLHEIQEENHEALKNYMHAYNLALEHEYEAGKRFTHNIGYAYKKIGNYSKALHFLTLCVHYLSTTNMTGRLANAYNELGNTFMLSGIYHKAHEALNEGRRLSVESKSNSFLKENYLFTSKLYEEENNYEKAFEFLKKHHDILETLNIEKQNKEIVKLLLSEQIHNKEAENEVIMQKNMELEAYSKALNDSNEQLTATLNAMEQMQLKVLQSEKNASFNRMMVGISHQLNTSLSNITLMSSQILNENTKISEKFKGGDLTRKDLFTCIDQVRESAELIYFSTKKITHFVDKIKSSNTTLDDLSSTGSIKVILDELNEHYQKQAQQNKCKIVINIQEDLPNIMGYNIFKNLLFQLMDNALKYAFQNTEDNKIEIRIHHNSKGRLVVTFKDNGIGIEETILHRIFDPFYTTNMGYDGGDGLGLYLLQRTVEDIFEGNIQCESSKNMGTTFMIELGNHSFVL
ncbi:MAG: tetratricopeptide repeat-containing sensor histidine kinase [Clostridia bacterium]|nr:tetratricopeptide repeat-containing sensor histidine kinase [Clostridia bacterium]